MSKIREFKDLRAINLQKDIEDLEDFLKKFPEINHHRTAKIAVQNALNAKKAELHQVTKQQTIF